MCNKGCCKDKCKCGAVDALDVVITVNTQHVGSECTDMNTVITNIDDYLTWLTGQIDVTTNVNNIVEQYLDANLCEKIEECGEANPPIDVCAELTNCILPGVTETPNPDGSITYEYQGTTWVVYPPRDVTVRVNPDGSVTYTYNGVSWTITAPEVPPLVCINNQDGTTTCTYNNDTSWTVCCEDPCNDIAKKINFSEYFFGGQSEVLLHINVPSVSAPVSAQITINAVDVPLTLVIGANTVEIPPEIWVLTTGTDILTIEFDNGCVLNFGIPNPYDPNDTQYWYGITAGDVINPPELSVLDIKNYILNNPIVQPFPVFYYDDGLGTIPKKFWVVNHGEPIEVNGCNCCPTEGQAFWYNDPLSLNQDAPILQVSNETDVDALSVSVEFTDPSGTPIIEPPFSLNAGDSIKVFPSDSIYASLPAKVVITYVGKCVQTVWVPAMRPYPPKDVKDVQTGLTGVIVNLPSAPISGTIVDVYKNGLLLAEGIDYTISALGVITFNVALIVSDVVTTRYKTNN